MSRGFTAVDVAASSSATAVALRLMLDLAATSYGPGGRSKIVRAGAAGGNLTVTTTSHRLLGALTLENPVARVLAQLIASRQERGADGGLLTIMIACGIVLGSSSRRLPPRLCAALLSEALDRGVRIVLDGSAVSSHAPCRPAAPNQGAAASLKMSNLPCLLSIVRAVLKPKHVALPSGCNDDADQLALLLVTCFVQSLADEAPDRSAAPEDDLSAVGPSAKRAATFLPGESSVVPRHATKCPTPAL